MLDYFPDDARPAPVQQRGRRRREAILDAAEALMIEGGYEKATLKAISERTSIPIASVYHYFKDRSQVDLQIAQRHAEGLSTSVATAVQAAQVTADLDAVIRLIIQTFVDYYRRHPSFVELWLVRNSSAISTAASEFDAYQAERIWQLLLNRGLIAADTPKLAMRLAYEAGSRVLDMAFIDDRTGDTAIIDGAVRLVTAYLCTYASAG